MRSVVLASYQGERFIGAQLESILSQLSPDDEVVISDDASTDHTLDVVARCGDARIKVLANRVRIGYVGNFQRAIDHSRGDSVFFSDQDDVWLPNKIAMMDSALRAHPCVASDAIVVNDRLETLQSSFFALRGARSFSVQRILLKPMIIGATLGCQRRYLQTLLPVPAGVPHDFWLSVNAAWDKALGIIASPLILYRRHLSVASTSATDRKRALRTIVTERGRILGALMWRRSRPYRRARALRKKNVRGT